MLNKITSGLRWRYELYLSEYIDLFGSVSYFVQFGLAWFKPVSYTHLTLPTTPYV